MSDYPFEDTVQCLLFSFNNEKYDTYWEELCISINKIILELSQDYIWHRDNFKVYNPIIKEKQDIPHLLSNTCFGDNIEDEWFIVYLVLEITKLYKDLVVQILDNDGDFLMIEAADCLPTWANPETTKNRVFVYDHHIYLIPPEIANLDTKLDVKSSLNILKENKEQCKVTTEIMQAILKRIGNYPDKIIGHFHNVLVKLPLNIATLLTLKPSLISPLVNSYCNRDIIDTKACKNIDFENCVIIKVKLTKFMYAMIMHSNMMQSIKNIEGDKKTSMGLKLTCGHHIITSKYSSNFATTKFKTYMENLKKIGYFNDNIEGSQKYNQLFDKAKDYFANTECPINSIVSQEISQIMLSPEFLELRKNISDHPLQFSDNDEDQDDWLNVHPEELNHLLNDRYGKEKKFNDNTESITTKLSHFLTQSSDFEGIEVNKTVENDESLEIDTDEFVAAVEKMLKFVTSEQDDMSDLSDDDDSLDFSNDLENNCENSAVSDSVVQNLLQSIKEEEGSSGPSSNLFRNIGVNKNSLLDSDDD